MNSQTYLNELDHPQKDQLLRLDAIVRGVRPDLEPELFGGMGPGAIVGYGRYHYRYDSGREGDYFVVGFAPRKSFISLYSMAPDSDGYFVEKFAPRFGKVKTGRSCINFKDLYPVSDELLETFINESFERMEKYCQEKGWTIH